MTTQEGNKLIAGIMGLKYQKNRDGVFPTEQWVNTEGDTSYARLYYATSWDWLMPACKKMYDQLPNKLAAQLKEAVGTFDIEVAFPKAVEGAKWLADNADKIVILKQDGKYFHLEVDRIVGDRIFGYKIALLHPETFEVKLRYDTTFKGNYALADTQKIKK